MRPVPARARARAALGRRSSSTVRTSCPIPAGAPTARRSAGWSGTTRTCRGTAPGSWWRRPTAVVRCSSPAVLTSRCSSPAGTTTARSGSSPTAAAGGTSTAGRRTARSSRWSLMDAEIGLPQWVFGESRYAFLSGDRVVFAYSREGFDHLAVRGADGVVHELDTPFTSIGSVSGHGAEVVLIGASPTAEAAVVRFRRARRSRRLDVAAFEVLRPPRELDLPDGLVSVPEPIDFPTAGGAVAHGLYYPPTNPGFVGPARPAPAAPRDDPRWSDRGRHPRPAAERAVLDVAGLRRRRRQLPRLHRLRSFLPQPLARLVGCRRRRGLRGRGPLARRRRPRRPGPPLHPRRLGGWLHDPGRDGHRRHVLCGRQPLRRRRPRGARPGDAQVREPVPRPS